MLFINIQLISKKKMSSDMKRNTTKNLIDEVNSGDDSDFKNNQSTYDTDDSNRNVSSKKKKKDKKDKKDKKKNKDKKNKKKKDKSESGNETITKKKKRDKKKIDDEPIENDNVSDVDLKLNDKEPIENDNVSDVDLKLNDKEPIENDNVSDIDSKLNDKEPIENDNVSDIDSKSNDDDDSKSIKFSSKLKKNEILESIRKISEEEQTPSQKNYLISYLHHENCKKNLVQSKFLMQQAEKIAIDDYKKRLKKKDQEPKNPRKSGFSQEYNIPESLKIILDSDDFKEYSSYNNDEDGVPKITASQLVDSCRNFVIDKDGSESKGNISFKNEDTPIYSIFSEYLDALDNGILEKKYKPSQASQDADRSKLSRIQMISFACKYLKWINKV
jgi:hypothetical protein